VGYDGVLSIEHEDSLMAADEGLQKAIAFLREVMIEKPRGKTWFEMDHEAVELIPVRRPAQCDDPSGSLSHSATKKSRAVRPPTIDRLA
jgi:hypothetical protein